MTLPLQARIEERTFHFKQPAGTSRGVYRTRKSWFITLTDKEGRQGIGECAPLPNLSCDDIPNYAEVLARHCRTFEQTGEIPFEALRPHPSMLFGMETAMLHLKSGGLQFYDTPWSRGEKGIPINGLVWMGTKEEMQERLIEKIEAGFSCIKLKIGVDLEGELELLEYVRRRFGRDEVQLRVDANGAFSTSEAGEILRWLHSYDLHSIEQPIRAGQWKDMARLCRISSLPIALDEELIGINELQEKERLLDEIKPSYLVLKPSLHGGMQGTREWVELARQRGIGSWVTSALESNVGLHAIAHLTTQLYGNHIEMAQGLGTGLLYTDNIDMPLCIKGQEIWHQ